MRVLIVEDHRELAETVATGLREDGMDTDLAYDGQEAIDRATSSEYDVIVLDRDLPRLHAAFEAQRRFVANASHELRTPLTLQRAMVEVALSRPGADAASLRAVCERVVAAGRSRSG
ncbi:response regulator [Streptomyces sp. NBC_01808]|nr:response regulator [Streptomyces sp. NBC_01808]